MTEVLAKIAEVDGLITALITGIITFLITKYTYHKSIPLDKQEIAYNRVYYPIYNLLHDSDNNTIIIEKSEKYLNKYKKYVDRSTMVAYKFLKNNPDNRKAYENYKDNIYAINSRLRSRLGYLEPNILSLYTYLAPDDKRILRIVLELIVVYVSICVYAIIDYEIIRQGAVSVFTISFISFAFETVISILILGKKKLKVFWDSIRENE